MATSRRMFLAGAFAMPLVRALAAATNITSPRTWTWLQYTVAPVSSGATALFGRWCAMRNDGIYFTTVKILWLEDHVGCSPAQWSELMASMREETRMQLNDFLDSRCHYKVRRDVENIYG